MSISFGAVGVVMAEGPYVVVAVQGTNADGLYCVKSKLAAPPTMVYDDDTEVVRVVVYVDYVDGSFDAVIHKVLPVSFNTVKLFVLGGEQTQPDQSFCEGFLDTHGVASTASVNLGQRQARLQGAFAVKHSAQLQLAEPKHQTRVGGQSQPLSVSQTHKRHRGKGQSVVGTNGQPSSRSMSRRKPVTQVIHAD